MKKNGFIATSLLYSFFLVFCALLLALVGTFMHNRVLLNSIIGNIKNELSESGKKTLMGAEIGSYIKIPLFSTGIKINTENLNWIVAEQDTTNKTLTLVSDNVVVMSNNYQDKNLLREETNRYFNLYTTGPDSSNYMNWLTREQITSFESTEDITRRKALLAANSEYIYYDLITDSFYLYKYSCDPNDICAPLTPQKILTSDTKQYGLRFVMRVSGSAPISTGIGILNDPYVVLYYVHQNETDNILKLHYDNINYNGNLGFKSSDNYFTDLSGNNPNGLINTGTFTNDINNGATIPANSKINTNLNIYSIINNPSGYTIEFRVKDYLQLSSYPNYLNNFILLTNNTTLKLSTSSYPTTLTTGNFNTFSVVKRAESSTLNVYINGNPISNITVNNLNSLINDILYVGGSSYSEIIKSIRVYDKALTDAEIIHNYNVDERWRIT